jgi:hypothetical protein
MLGLCVEKVISIDGIPCRVHDSMLDARGTDTLVSILVPLLDAVPCLLYHHTCIRRSHFVSGWTMCCNNQLTMPPWTHKAAIMS